MRWLGSRHRDEGATRTGERIERAVKRVVAEPGNGTPDLGGELTTSQLGGLIVEAVKEQ